MAKKRSTGSTPQRRRDVNNIANRRLPPLKKTIKTQFDLVDYLRDIEDRRTYHPDHFHMNAASTNRRTHILKLPDTTTHPNMPKRQLPARIAFTDPQKVLVCIRRKRREEVLHALKKTGTRGQKTPKRNYFSEIIC